MNSLLYPIVIPFITGLLCLLPIKRIKGLREGLAIGGSLVTFVITLLIFIQKPCSGTDFFILDNLAGFILLFIGLFGVIIAVYSIGFMEKHARIAEYYAYLLWTIGASCGAVLSNSLILLLVFWGFLGLTLYLMITLGGPEASEAAKKTFVIIGGSDSLMIMGLGILYFSTGQLFMDRIHLSLGPQLPVIAFLCLLIASLAKAGAMPFHTWIPDMAEKAPVPVTAFLPASLDKLLGIYLLARICLNLFSLNSQLSTLLMIVGSVTIVAAVFMAMFQHDLKRLLSYHAVSQVGYMVLGIGTGNPIGIAGGLFHMLNNAIYKSCLFLCGGAVEKKTGTSDLDKLGGLSKVMPITFMTCLVAALSISGVPPFNGFFSKWMIYQGVIEMGKTGNRLWIIWLVAAMFGSALTLASFMKLIHTTFLGAASSQQIGIREGKKSPAPRSSLLSTEVSFSMWLPMVVLAGLCIIFGIFSYTVPIKNFILPAVPELYLIGKWSTRLAAFLILVGLFVGLAIYLVGKIKIRRDITYIGGEEPDMRVSGVDFYQTISDYGLFKLMYKGAEKKVFDIYDWGKGIISYFVRMLSFAHSGILPTYLSWAIAGIVIIVFVLMS